MAVKRVLLLGPPASGKGTQARYLVSLLDVPCLGTGKLLRSEIEKSTEIGKLAEQYINNGEYVPDQVIMDMVKSWLNEEPQVISGWLIDGFPRTFPQAEALQEMREPELVIALDVPEDELERRISMRRECFACHATVAVNDSEQVQCPICNADALTSRSDDAIDSFKVRCANFKELTTPLFNYYAAKGILRKVDGTQHPDTISNEIESIIKNS